MQRFVAAILAAAVLPLASAPLSAATLDELRVTRANVFEFTEKPSVTRAGDRVTISFASKAYCDATIAIEDEQGKIVRHLASGVLGPNAPEPFQKNSLRQTVVWDGKDDRGIYIDDKASLTVRVSLGLRARFEKTLFWSPHKRISNIAPLLAPTPEGVFVFEGLGVDHLRLFDREGGYLRTVYPFPAEKIPQVVGLQMHTFPQDGATLPLKEGFEQGTLLTSGSSAWGGGGHDGGWAATAMAVHGKKIALAFHKLNRIATDGTSGGLPIQGPKISFDIRIGRRTEVVGPTSVAFSPDGKYLYMTGYVWKTGAHYGEANCYHAVLRMEYEKDAAPQVFLGVLKTDDGWGTGNDRFCVPTGIACDAKGRIYVADYINDRIQVFSPDGTYLKTIPVRYPATVQIDPKTGEIWAFTFPMIGPSSHVMRERNFDPRKADPMVTRLGTFEKPVRGVSEPLPGVDASTSGGWVTTGGQSYQAAVDFHGAAPRIWLVGRKATVSVAEANWMSGSGIWSFLGGWANRGIRLLDFKEGKWQPVADFAQSARRMVMRLDPPSFSRQRLYVSPATEKLYVAEEQTGAGKSFYTVLCIDPESGKITEVKLPFDAEDMIFDIDGRVYLCTDREIMRFDPATWREVPWDYGEERQGVGFASSGALPRCDAISALPIPGTRPVWWHSSGMWISPRGHLAVALNVPGQAAERNEKDKYFNPGITRPFTPDIYPGRSGSRVVQIFDQHGKLIHRDAVPGLTNCDGIGIDKDDNIYAMVAAPPVYDGKPYFDDKAETLMKFKPNKTKFLSSGLAPVPLTPEMRPTRSPDITKYGMSATWAEGVEWTYGGVGYGGQGGSCTCWHSRFQLDYFARSFAPEVRRFKVAVLDTNGNLIMRIGRYGNVDDGVPLKPMVFGESEQDKVAFPPQSAARSPKPLGGDEVSLVHAAYLGIHTDRRLFIADAGNGRILSVALDYHAQASVPLKDVPDGK